MVRPCVARGFRRSGGRRSCINVSGLALERLLRATMDISARAILLADRPRSGHLGHQCSHAPGRPILHIRLRPLADRGRVMAMSSDGVLPISGSSFVRVWHLFLRPGLRSARAPRTGAVKTGRRGSPVPCSAIGRPRLDGPEHGADTQAQPGAASALTQWKSRSLWSTAQAIRASLLASAMASTL